MRAFMCSSKPVLSIALTDSDVYILSQANQMLVRKGLPVLVPELLFWEYFENEVIVDLRQYVLDKATDRKGLIIAQADSLSNLIRKLS